MSKYQFAIKRMFDIMLSFWGLLFLWPVIFICMVVASFETGLPGLFSQMRIGKNAVKITVYKVRTMRNISEISHTTVTVENDPRITGSGRIFRKYKLDELPQLWNVLIGDMSFVGPRPDVPGYADQLEGVNLAILLLRPGITGPASLKYKNEEKLLSTMDDPIQYNDSVIYPDKVDINLNYLNNWSLSKDIGYLLMTLGFKRVPEWLKLQKV